MGQFQGFSRQKAAYSESFKRGAQVILPLAHGLNDEELLEKLGGYGLHLDRDSLGKWSATAGSAEEVTRRLIVHDRNKPGLPDEQMVWIWVVIQVLWERWVPESPSFEMLDDRIAEGNDRPNRSEACEVWLDAWRILQRLGDKLQIHTLREFDQRFEGTELLQNCGAGF